VELYVISFICALSVIIAGYVGIPTVVLEIYRLVNDKVSYLSTFRFTIVLMHYRKTIFSTRRYDEFPSDILYHHR
jgi:hypothetical protein